MFYIVSFNLFEQTMKAIKELIFSQTGKDTFIVSFGTLISVIAGGLFFILVPRYLGPRDFGIFSTIVATGLMASSLANFAIDSGILKFAAKNDEKSNQYLSIAIKSYVIFAAVVSFIGLVFTPVISRYLNLVGNENLLRVGFFSIIFLNLTNFYVASLQAKKEFFKASQLNIVSNVLRILLVLISILFFRLNLAISILIFFLIPISSIVIGFYYMKFKLENTSKQELFNFHKYNFWLAAALIISSIPYDNYFLIKTAGPVATGLYAAPYKLLTSVYQFGGNFTRVLASRYSSFDTSEQVVDFSKKTLTYTILFSFLLLLAIVLASPVIRIFLGNGYLDAIGVFRIMTVGFIFFTISTIPSAIIIYYFGKSNISFVVTSLKYAFLVLLLALLVPRLQSQGAALAFSASEALSLVLMSLYVLMKFKK